MSLDDRQFHARGSPQIQRAGNVRSSKSHFRPAVPVKVFLQFSRLVGLLPMLRLSGYLLLEQNYRNGHPCIERSRLRACHIISPCLRPKPSRSHTFSAILAKARESASPLPSGCDLNVPPLQSRVPADPGSREGNQTFRTEATNQPGAPYNFHVITAKRDTRSVLRAVLKITARAMELPFDFAPLNETPPCPRKLSASSTSPVIRASSHLSAGPPPPFKRLPEQDRLPPMVAKASDVPAIDRKPFSRNTPPRICALSASMD